MDFNLKKTTKCGLDWSNVYKVIILYIYLDMCVCEISKMAKGDCVGWYGNQVKTNMPGPFTFSWV
jgi:hypothetical protein